MLVNIRCYKHVFRFTPSNFHRQWRICGRWNNPKIAFYFLASIFAGTHFGMSKKLWIRPSNQSSYFQAVKRILEKWRLIFNVLRLNVFVRILAITFSWTPFMWLTLVFFWCIGLFSRQTLLSYLSSLTSETGN